MEKDNTTKVLTRFVNELAIPVTAKSISDQLEKHPDYDSLLAFSDVLDRFNVPNAAYKLSYDQLVDVPVPFIAHLKDRKFGVVTTFGENEVKISHDRWNGKTFPTEEFKKQYGGSVLVAEKDETSGEAGFDQKHRAEIINSLRMPVVATGGLLILVGILLLHSAFLSSLTIPIALLTLFKTAGLTTSVLLLMQSIDANNPLIHKLCGGDSNKDCNAILSSKAAKVNQYLSWSEVGFFYFAGSWLALLFTSGHFAVVQTLAILNILALPYTVYSIYYQWRVAKQWCIFCCTVQALLWLEFFAFIPYLHSLILPNLTESANLLMGMAAPLLGWILVKPYLLQAKQITPLKKQLRVFKYNKDLFNKLLNEEIKYALLNAENSLTIGNRDAEHTITMVSNPYCQPCAKAHKALDEWLVNRPDIKLQVIFSTSNNEKDKKTEVATHLMNLQKLNNNATLKKALDDWYDQKQKDYGAWANVHHAATIINMHNELEAQKEWCKMVEIKGTPTLFLNGRRLPKNYQPEDLEYFI